AAQQRALCAHQCSGHARKPRARYYGYQRSPELPHLKRSWRTMHPSQVVVILDFGSQYTQLIARRIRQLRVYCEIHPHTLTHKQVEALKPSAVILSGGPSSVYDDGAPGLDDAILKMDVPRLG